MVKLRAGKSHLERLIQHLYPLELEREARKGSRDAMLDAGSAPDFRPRRNTAQQTKGKLTGIAMYEDDKL